MSAVVTVAGHHLRRNARAFVLIAVVWGVVGGVALGAFAAARRTSSVVDRFVSSFAPLDLDVQPAPGIDAEAIARLPGVASLDVTEIALLDVVPEDPSVWVLSLVSTFGRSGVEFDRFLMARGRAPSPDEPLEAVVNEALADRLALAPGDVVSVHAYREKDQRGRPSGPVLDLEITGIHRSPSDLLPVADSPDGGGQRFFLHLTPAFREHYGDEVFLYSGDIDVRLEAGERDLPRFEAALSSLPGGADAVVRTACPECVAGEVLRDVYGAQARALVIFGVIVAVLGLVGCGQVLVRRLGTQSAELRVLAALGAGRVQLGTIVLVQAAAIAVAGAAIAVAVAAVTSLVTPFGAARRAELQPGLELDVPMLVVGGTVAAVALAAWALPAVAMALTAGGPAAPRRTLASVDPAPPRARRRVVGTTPAMATGAAWTLTPGRNTGAGATMLGFAAPALGVAAIVAGLTFAASLDGLLATPAQQGIMWDAVAGAGPRSELVAASEVVAADDAVAGSAFYAEVYDEAVVDDNYVSLAVYEHLSGDTRPRLLDGREPQNAAEIVLGHDLLQELDRSVDDLVTVGRGSNVVAMRIVGSAVLWSMPYSSLSLGDGALVTTAGLELVLPNADEPDGTLLLDYRPGVDRAEVDRRISAQLEELGVFGPAMPPPTPDGLRVLEAVRHFPLLLAGAVAVLAVAVVGQLVVTATRHRRFDLAVLGALGCLRRQLGAVVSWHATTLALAACVVGIPLGVAAGRWAWGFVRQDLGATAGTDVPWAAVVLVAPLAVLAANAVAAIPAWRARSIDQAAALGTQQ